MPVKWRVLYIDDDPDYIKGVIETLNGAKVLEPDHTLSIEAIQDFDEALSEIENKRYDLVIIDLRLGDTLAEVAEEEGIKTLESIKSRRFLPVIFYTVLPGKVEALSSQLIKVVDKKDGEEKLLEEIKDMFNKRLPIVNRALITHMEEIQREYMWDFVANNWEAFGDTPDRTSLAYLLARRLAKSLDGPGIEKLAEKLGDSTNILCSEDNVHPMRYYIVPPMGIGPMPGDVIKEEEGTRTKYMVLITPSCDIVQGKVDHMLFAYCTPLRETEEYIDWENNPDDPGQKYISRLLPLLTDKKERFFFLPSVFNIPDLIVDYQKVITLEPSEFGRLIEEKRFECVACLDNPYCEALLARYSRYFGRLGTPDLNIDIVMKRLEEERKKTKGEE